MATKAMQMANKHSKNESTSLSCMCVSRNVVLFFTRKDIRSNQFCSRLFVCLFVCSFLPTKTYEAINFVPGLSVLFVLLV